jgi:23S rRNA (cytosine1962-C5)-methyltransferase
MDATPGYDLLDAGDGRRLERFGDLVVDRPHPGAMARRRDPAAWRTASLRFDRVRGWTGTVPADGWEVVLGELRLGLRATPSGGVGLFPEHLIDVPWLRARVERRVAPAVLHLFAHTGLLTLVAAASGGHVVHVDAARPAVAWARDNATRSGLGDRPIRWIVDDALAFLRREARRGHAYDLVILDPPSHGRADGRAWHLADQLDALLAATRAVTARGGDVLLSAHTPGFEADTLARHLAAAFGSPDHRVAPVDLVVAARSGASLDLGGAARLEDAPR